MRKIKKIITSQTTIEGAGVKLQRVFGPSEIPLFDPFLLLDHFGSSNPADYVRGFPWHPHRGIETVTYLLHGEVEHGDSIGNKGVIKSGDVQWMTAGSGIIHQEMPKIYKGEMQGFQLWINLPKKKKMCHPRYRGLTKKDLKLFENHSAKVKIIAGKFGNKQGPVKDLSVDVEYFDVKLTGTFKHDTKKKTVFLYVIEGSLTIANETITDHHCVLLSDKGEVVITADKARFLLIAGNPLNEPIAWGGPIVMNTQKELKEAFRELENDEFIKHTKPVDVHEDYYTD